MSYSKPPPTRIPLEHWKPITGSEQPPQYVEVQLRYPSQAHLAATNSNSSTAVRPNTPITELTTKERIDARRKRSNYAQPGAQEADVEAGLWKIRGGWGKILAGWDGPRMRVLWKVVLILVSIGVILAIVLAWHHAYKRPRR